MTLVMTVIIVTTVTRAGTAMTQQQGACLKVVGGNPGGSRAGPKGGFRRLLKQLCHEAYHLWILFFLYLIICLNHLPTAQSALLMSNTGFGMSRLAIFVLALLKGVLLAEQGPMCR